MDVIFRSPRGMMKDGIVILDYDLSEVDDWENLFTYEGTPEFNEEGYEISDLDPITQQIIIHSGWFHLPVLDELGIQEWLLRQHVLNKLGCYPNPITAEQLFRHAGLKTSADFLSTRGWFTDVLYEMVINQVDNYSYKEYYDYNRKLESEARRKHLRIVK